jgi:tRNA modification GTPase
MTPYNPLNDDTIAAIATPFGLAGIGIVRMSGPGSLEIAGRLFRPKRPTERYESHHLYLGRFIQPSTGHMIDEVLMSHMKAPNSYTGEDVIEINSHSGHILLSTILQTILDEGARLAHPGEFTFRAFLNGKIDLTQAEAIMDLVNAKSEKGLMLASRQIRGELRGSIEELRQKAIDLLANTEVAIDFPEEESNLLPREKTASLIESGLIEPVEKVIADHDQRKIWMEGSKTVIAGRVNAGKSSLFNRMLNKKRAIVTPTPGTTRDVIESTIYIEGFPLRLMDTAGIRKVRGKIERIGVQLSEENLSEADLALIVIDQSRPLNDDDLSILEKSPKEKSIVVINKIDLSSRLDERELKGAVNDLPTVKISALTGEGMDSLCRAIQQKVLGGDLDNCSLVFAPNQRHTRALSMASRYFRDAVISIREELPMEIIAVDLRGGLDALSEITGETDNEMIYEKIFSDFCLGK